MAAGAVLVIIATFMQCFSPRGNIGVFIAGRVVIGLGQGLALSKQFLHQHATCIIDRSQLLALFTSENFLDLKYEVPSCLFGRCSILLVPSLRT